MFSYGIFCVKQSNQLCVKFKYPHQIISIQSFGDVNIEQDKLLNKMISFENEDNCKICQVRVTKH